MWFTVFLKFLAIDYAITSSVQACSHDPTSARTKTSKPLVCLAARPIFRSCQEPHPAAATVGRGPSRQSPTNPRGGVQSNHHASRPLRSPRRRAMAGWISSKLKAAETLLHQARPPAVPTSPPQPLLLIPSLLTLALLLRFRSTSRRRSPSASPPPPPTSPRCTPPRPPPPTPS